MPHSFHIRIDILYSYRKLRGNAVHCLASYFVYDKCEHAVCNAHLLRDLKAFYEQTFWSKVKRVSSGASPSHGCDIDG